MAGEARIALLLVLVIGGCAGLPRAIDARRTTIDETYSIEPRVAWTAVGSGHDMMWTIDGPLLERIRFITAEAGKPIMPGGGGDAKSLPIYQSGMNPIEIREALESALGIAGLDRITTTEFAPAPFGGLPGYRWEYAAVNADGLEVKGLVLAAEHGGKLQIISYSGARIYYFDHHKETVERLLGSIVVR